MKNEGNRALLNLENKRMKAKCREDDAMFKSTQTAKTKCESGSRLAVKDRGFVPILTLPLRWTE